MNGFFRTRRVAFLLAGLTLLGVARLTPALEWVENYPFSARMMQHLLLQLVIPPLLLLSLPLSDTCRGAQPPAP